MKCKHRFLSGPIFSLGILLLLSSAALATDTLPLLRMADEYYEHKNYDASVSEYWRFIYFSGQHPYLFYAYYKAGLAEVQLNNRDQAEAMFRRALQLAPTENYQRHIRYQLILNLIYAGKYDIAKIELFKIQHNKNASFLRYVANLYMGLLYLSEKSYAKARQEFSQLKNSGLVNPAGRQKLERADSLLTILSGKEQYKSPRLAKWLSTFLPGIGQIYAGKITSGLDALALNTLTGFFLYKMIERKKYRDAALVASMLWWRYYNGSRLRAEQAAVSANELYQQNYSKEIFHLLGEIELKIPWEKVLIEWRDLPERTE